MKAFAILGLSALLASCSDTDQCGTTQVADLTHVMHEDMPFWPGGVPFKKEALATYENDGYLLYKFEMGENTGTHVDAPAHFIEGKNSIDQLSTNQLILPVVVIDAQAQVADNPDYELTVDDITNWEAEYGRIPADSLVVMNSGWYKRFDNPATYLNQDANNIMHFPGYSVEAATLLIDRNISGIGIDTLSLDHGPSTTFATHVAMLQANKYQIENMANLDALPATGATAIIGVLPVRDGSQAQARIFALWNNAGNTLCGLKL